MADLGAVGFGGLTTERSGLYLSFAWTNNGAFQGLTTLRTTIPNTGAWSNHGGQQGLTTKRNNIPAPLSVSMLNAYIGEIKIYNEAKDQAWIESVTGPTSDDTDSSLKFYVKCLEKDGSNIVPGSVGDFDISAPNADDVIDTETYPPLRFGESFVVKRFTVSATAPCSIKFPLTPPDDVNFALVVMWIDNDGNAQRRLLWDSIAGGSNRAVVEIEPPIFDYNGEPLPATFYLEVYGVDEIATADLEDDFTIYLSLTTQPITSHDHINQIDNTPAGSVNIAETFPLVFPLTFDQPLTIIS